MAFTTHISPILHLSLVLQRFFWRLNILYLTYSFPQNIFIWPKISNYYGNYQETTKKMYLLFLYSTYGRVTTNGPRNYIRITSRTKDHQPPCHSFLSILVCVRGRSNGSPWRRIKSSVQILLVYLNRERLSSCCVCLVSGAGEKRKCWKTEQETDGRCDLLQLPILKKTSDKPGCSKIRTEVRSAHLQREASKPAQQGAMSRGCCIRVSAVRPAAPEGSEKVGPFLSCWPRKIGGADSCSCNDLFNSNCTLRSEISAIMWLGK